MAADSGATADETLFEMAEQCYREGRWSQAAMLYRMLHLRHPALAQERGVAMALGHCEIEQRDDVDPLALGRSLVPLVPQPATHQRSATLRLRGLELCRAGDFARAGRVLLFLANFDQGIAVTFRDSFAKGRSGCWEPYLAAPAEEPEFLQVDRWTDDDIAADKARFRGLKVLLVLPWNMPFSVGDRYRRSALAYGLAAQTLEFFEVVGDFDPAGAAARLQQRISAFRPQVILCNGLTELFRDPGQQRLIESLSAVFEAARHGLGARVVASFGDAWLVPDERLTQGLGRAFDLVHHTHPALTRQPALNRADIYCYFHPVVLPTPTVAAATIPRAIAAGGFTITNPARIVWWAQIGMSDLPLDFVETKPVGDEMLTAERYTNLLREYQLTLGLTQRANGVNIVTGRTLETLVAGGVLVEENSFDTRYFLKPGLHYVPFETWADLCELIPWLLGNPDYRRSLAHEGHAWAQRHFTGDWFWSGLLRRLNLARGT